MLFSMRVIQLGQGLHFSLPFSLHDVCMYYCALLKSQASVITSVIR